MIDPKTYEEGKKPSRLINGDRQQLASNGSENELVDARKMGGQRLETENIEKEHLNHQSTQNLSLWVKKY